MVRVFTNDVLLASMIAWAIAQSLKVPLGYLLTKRLDWALLLGVGGMPSSHSALVAACAQSTGLYLGFDSPIFALAVVLAIVVIYDATGIRRQAGKQAEIINTMIDELAHGHPLRREQLREVLGHTPLEALAGTVLGIVVAQLMWIVTR